jgi:hypothetical protein
MSIVRKISNKTHLSLRYAFQLILASIDAPVIGGSIFVYYGMTKGTLPYGFYTLIICVQYRQSF